MVIAVVVGYGCITPSWPWRERAGILSMDLGEQSSDGSIKYERSRFGVGSGRSPLDDCEMGLLLLMTIVRNRPGKVLLIDNGIE